MTTDLKPLTSEEMARLRTTMASDRTLMAWVRTALSMISFGFAIYKFFQYLYESRPQEEVPNSPRNLVLMLTALALLGLVAGLLEHRHTTQQLGRLPARSFWNSAPVVTAIAVATIAALMFVSALWHGPL